MAINQFYLFNQGEVKIKGDIINKIKLAYDGNTAIVNYAGKILFEIDIKNLIYGKSWDFQDNHIFWFYPSKSDKTMSFILFNEQYGVLDLSTEGSIWIKEGCFTNRKVAQLSEDSKMVALMFGNSISIYETATGIERYTIDVETNDDSKLLFSPNNEIITHMGYNTLSAFELPTCKKLWEIPVSGGCGYDIWSFSHDSEKIVMANLDEVSKILLSKTSDQIETLKKGNDERTNQIFFTIDDKRIIACSCDKSVRVWDLENHKLQTINEHEDNWIESAFITKDNKRIVTFTPYDNSFYLWNFENGDLLDKINFDFSVDDFHIKQKNSDDLVITVIGINDYKMDSTAFSTNRRPRVINIRQIGTH